MRSAPLASQGASVAPHSTRKAHFVRLHDLCEARKEHLSVPGVADGEGVVNRDIDLSRSYQVS